MKELSKILVAVIHPSRLVDEIEENNTEETSLFIGIAYGILVGFNPIYKDNLGLIFGLVAGIMSTLLGIIIFSELLKWVSSWFKSKPSKLFRSIVAYSLIPLIISSILSSFISPSSIKMALQIISICWTLLIMIIMVSKHRKISFLESSAAIIITILINITPMILIGFSTYLLN
ncbi:MAG: YIP1 family protein [Bacteroidetes bacterium]|nr:YIP1 family protein [Bacteroidota bacterium]